MVANEIRKTIALKSDRARAWRAISESARFGAWFGVEFDGPFAAGSEMTGRIAPTKVDPAVAALQEPHKGKRFQILIERIEPMTRFAFRWHPFAIDPNHDYSGEPMTLVTFDLSDAPGGTLLTITESGFENIPTERRAQAFKANDGSWTHQTALIQKYLSQDEAQRMIR